MKRYITYYLIITFVVLAQVKISATDKQIEAGVDEKLGNYLPMDAVFQTSDGDTVTLGQVITKPTLLALVYYDCPGICAPLLTELSSVVGKIDLVPGEDFEVVTLSFDHHENSATAKRWKKSYFDGMKNPFPENAWTFLTGDSLNIRKVTDAAGFYFIPNEDKFVHAGVLIAISPKGKISRYVFGLLYNQFDLKMALLEAQAGKTSPTISKVLQYCFSYDPAGRKYTLNVTRIIGSIMLLAAGIFFAVLTIKKKKKN
jgi:protein SCO1